MSRTSDSKFISLNPSFAHKKWRRVTLKSYLSMTLIGWQSYAERSELYFVANDVEGRE